MSTPPAGRTARELLVEWANTQDHWARAIVGEVLLTRRELSEAALEGAYRACLTEKQLAAGPAASVAPLGLDTAGEARGQAFRLTRLTKVQNVNARPRSRDHP
jgi:hypothetical protein